MTKMLRSHKDQISHYLADYFNDRKYFACIYGSHANGKKNKDSDIDVLVATREYSETDVDCIKNFILDVHKNNGLKLDNEVPFENKLLITYADFKDAVNLKAFPKVRGKFTVPEVVKSNKFLSSKNIKLRLAFNALTSPHFVTGNDPHNYETLKALAEKNLVLFAINISGGSPFTKKDLVDALFKGNHGEKGEMYLGYKEYPSVIKYLKNIINKETADLKKR